MKTKILDESRTQEFWKKVKEYSIGGATMEEVNEAISIANATKQDKLTGIPGQVVGFDAAGNAVAQSYEDAGEIYSTEEVRIGTWIDGRPIYRKVFYVFTPSTSKVWVSITEAIDNVSIVVRLTGMNQNNAAFLPIPTVAGAWIRYNIDNKTIEMYVNSAGNKISSYIIMDYTKTTDPATISQSSATLLSSVGSVNISQASSAKAELTAIKSTEQVKT